jgi:hypothetical protein
LPAQEPSQRHRGRQHRWIRCSCSHHRRARTNGRIAEFRGCRLPRELPSRLQIRCLLSCPRIAGTSQHADLKHAGRAREGSHRADPR